MSVDRSAKVDRDEGQGAAPVGRLAPSPTGRLHVGHARSFLLAWWHARSRGGRVVLRIEDLDGARSRPEFVDSALRDLEWLGLDWDGEPLVQSRDTEALEDALDRLLATGAAYPCTCTRREIEAHVSAPHPDVSQVRYPGTCRDRYASVAEAEAESGRAAGVRYRVPPGPVRWRDELAGEERHDLVRDVGDFLVARRDGIFAYQLAVVVDDARQGVNEVVRGDDLVASTPRQWLLQDTLGLPHPRWWHVPLVVGDDGERLAKRSGSLALASLREAGVDPRRLVAWVAKSAGVETGELVTTTEVARDFDLGRMPRVPARFGDAELRAICEPRTGRLAPARGRIEPTAEEPRA